VSHIGLGTGDHTEPGTDDDYEEPRRRRRFRGCLPVLIVFVVLIGGAWYGGRLAYDALSTRFADAPDYPGPGSSSVLYQVKSGATSTQIGRELKTAGVVASVDAFNQAAADNDKSRNIQVGYYQLKKKMKAKEALDVLVDPASLVQSLVTVPEGARVQSIVKTIVAKTDITKRALTRALADPKALGLPAEAKGNPEGFLFPATYTVPPGQTAVQLLGQMVAKTVQTEKSLDIATKAMPLQSDATVAYANNNNSGTVYTTAEERQLDSRYNTYRYPGLPPGPIGSPGQKTIEAALNPSSGKQLFWVVVNLKTGETRYADTYADHLKNVAVFREYCQTSDAC
jgi:UPF0755 protein